MECIRGHVYALKPTAEQDALLAQTVGVVRLVYNLALEQRRIWGGRRLRDGSRLSFHAKGSSGELSALRRAFDWIGAVSQTAQNQALVDLDHAYAKFFSGKAGYPRPRKRGVDDSFRQAGREIELRRLNDKWAEVKVPKIGWIRLRLTRPLRLRADGCLDIRNATISRTARGWQISIATRCEIAFGATPEEAAGVDRGAAAPYVTSDGEIVLLPGSIRKREKTIRKAQQKLSRCKRGSKRQMRARARLARLQERNARTRAHLAHVTSRRLVRRYGLVAIEALDVKAMTASARGTLEAPGTNVAQKAGLNRSILRVGWHKFETCLGYKLEETGGTLIRVPAPYTSQTCSCCGHVDAKSRESQARFLCTGCGESLHADINAARNILARALPGAEKTWRRNTPLLDVEAFAQAACETSTPSRIEGLDAPT